MTGFGTPLSTIGLLWRSVASEVLDLFFPPRCEVCGRLGAWLCAECIDSIPRLCPPFCRVCGVPLVAGSVCQRCAVSPPEIDCIRSVGYFEGSLRQAIHAFKYDDVQALEEPLGRLIHDCWRKQPELKGVNLVVPVPLHQDRVRQRGYNQSALLADVFSSHAEVRVDVAALRRVRATVPQVGLTANKRRDNVEGAFACMEGALAGKHVLLIDDVCTTGATLEACAAALYGGGAATVKALTLARARPRAE